MVGAAGRRAVRMRATYSWPSQKCSEEHNCGRSKALHACMPMIQKFASSNNPRSHCLGELFYPFAPKPLGFDPQPLLRTRPATEPPPSPTAIWPSRPQ